MTDVCLVIGAGAGIGGHVGKRFASEGYHTALCRRNDQNGLDKMVAEIEEAGGSASGHLLNAVDEGAIEKLIGTALPRETVEEFAPMQPLPEGRGRPSSNRSGRPNNNRPQSRSDSRPSNQRRGSRNGGGGGNNGNRSGNGNRSNSGNRGGNRSAAGS